MIWQWERMISRRKAEEERERDQLIEQEEARLLQEDLARDREVSLGLGNREDVIRGGGRV